MKEIEVKGRNTGSKMRPDSLNIPERAEKCLDHMIENCDEKFNYVPYVGATLGEDPPHFAHHRLDWTEVLPYSVYGTVIARNIVGSRKGEDIQLAQRRLFLSGFNEMDGLIHAPKSPWNNSYPMCIWEQARAMYAFIYWFQDSGEEELLKYMDGIVDGLYGISYQEGNKRVFPVKFIQTCGMGPYGIGALIDPFTKYYDTTGNTKALQMASGVAQFMLDPGNGYFNENGKFKGFFRSVAAVVNSISKIASLTGEPVLLRKAKAIHDYAISFCTAYGSTPCREPACSNMELNMSALSLIRAGHEEYWDQIDRFARNQTSEAQFLDMGEWVREKALKGRRLDKDKWVTEFYPDDLHILPYDDYNDIVRRSIGGFMWTTADEHLFNPASLMLCCSAHAMRTYEIIWENALKESVGKVSVNLHFNVENDIGEVISYEPYVGKTSVILKKDADLKVRIPEYACGSEVKGTCEGMPVEIGIKGRHAFFGNVEKGKEYSLEYSLNKRTTEEKQYDMGFFTYENVQKVGDYEVKWRGNTVIGVLPESKEEKRIYKRKHLDSGEVPYKEVSYFISGKGINW